MGEKTIWEWLDRRAELSPTNFVSVLDVEEFHAMIRLPTI
jgi:hypothetical protein